MSSNYYGIPGGGDPNYRGGRQYRGKPGGGYQTDPRLWNMWDQSNDPSVNYQSNLGPGDPGGRNKNIGYGFGGEMTNFNSTPAYQAMTQQIDEQTQAEMDKLREEFGDAGMRWSTPLMGQQAQTLRRAAEDKNRLLTQMEREDFENAWKRQTQESSELYGRGRGEEQEAWDRAKFGDEFGWERAKFGADRGDRRFENLMRLDERQYDRTRGEEQDAYQRWLQGDQSAYGRWQDAYNRRQQMEQEMYGRWLTDDQNDFMRSQAAADFDLRLGGAQGDYDRQMQMDLWGMGGQERDWANQDLGSYYNEWLRQTQGYDQDIMGWLGQLMGGGGAPIKGKEDTDWAQWAQVLAALYGS